MEKTRLPKQVLSMVLILLMFLAIPLEVNAQANLLQQDYPESPEYQEIRDDAVLQTEVPEVSETTLSGNSENIGTDHRPINLTELGTLDWLHIADPHHNTNPSARPYRRMEGALHIDNYAYTSTLRPANWYSGATVGFPATYTNAEGGHNATDLRFGRVSNGVGSTFSFEVPSVDGEEREVTIYLSAWAAILDITAELNEEEETVRFSGAQGPSLSGIISFTFSGEGTLYITGTLVEAVGATNQWENFRMTAITLSRAPYVPQGPETELEGGGDYLDGSISIVSDTMNINLTALGTHDWRHMSGDTFAQDAVMADGNAISGYLEVGEPTRVANTAFIASATNAEDVGSFNNVNSGRRHGYGSIFGFSAAAAQDVEREVAIYVSAQYALLEVTAEFDGGEVKAIRLNAGSAPVSAIMRFKYTGNTNGDLIVTGGIIEGHDHAGEPSFTISAITVSSDETPFGVDLALGSAITASSSREGNIPAHAVDGNFNTRWESGQGAGFVNSWLRVDLGRVHEVNNVRIMWEAMFSINFTLTGSLDGVNFDIPLYTRTGKQNSEPDNIFFAPQRVQYVELRMTAFRPPSQAYSIFDFQVFRNFELPESQRVTGIELDHGIIVPTLNLANTILREYGSTVDVTVETLGITTTLSGGADTFLYVNGDVYESGETANVPLNIGENIINIVSADPNNPANYIEYIFTVFRLNYGFHGAEYRNMALGLPATSLQWYNSTGAPFPNRQGWSPLVNMVSGNRFNFAQPNTGINTPWSIVIDLEELAVIDQIQFISNRFHFLDEYRIYTSATVNALPVNLNAGINMADWALVTTENQGGGRDMIYRFAPRTARFVMIRGTAARNFSIVTEVEVYGVVISLEALILAVEGMVLERGDELLPISLPNGFEWEVISSSNPGVIDLDGNVMPQANIQGNSSVVIRITDTSTGIHADTSAISLNVPPLLVLESIEELQTVDVAIGMSLALARAALDETVGGIMSDTSVEAMSIVWGENSVPPFDGSVEGDYTFTGTVTLPRGILNENNIALTVTQVVRVIPRIPLTDLEVRATYPHHSNVQTTIIVPNSGYSHRRFMAFDQNNIRYNDVNWSYYPEKDFVTIDETGLMTVRPNNDYPPGTRLPITVHAVSIENSEFYDSFTGMSIEYIVNREQPRRDISEGPMGAANSDDWELFWSDEFGESIDRNAWTDNYLRTWTMDERSQARLRFEDSALVLRQDYYNVQPWASWHRDGPTAVNGIMTHERTGTHRFYQNRYEEARILPTFDGFATTKYGFFEVRAKMPNRPDGGHSAWWMIGTQDDMHNYEVGRFRPGNINEDWLSNQVLEIDIWEPLYTQSWNNTWQSVYHRLGTDQHFTQTQGSGTVNIPWTDGNITNEFHVWGFEWTPDEIIWYFNGRVIRRGSARIDHRMATIFAVYTASTGYRMWSGINRGYYPQDLTIDYYRIFKRNDTRDIPNDIHFDKTTLPPMLARPAYGETTSFYIDAMVIDQFHTPLDDVELHWYIAGHTPPNAVNDPNRAFRNQIPVQGVTIDPDTGRITVDHTVPLGSFRVAAKLASSPFGAQNRVRQSYRVLVVEPQASEATQIFFSGNALRTTIEIPATGERTFQQEARVYDQFLNPMDDLSIQYGIFIESDGRTRINPRGVYLAQDGTLTITSEAEPGDFFVLARSSDVTPGYRIEYALEDPPAPPNRVMPPPMGRPAPMPGELNNYDFQLWNVIEDHFFVRLIPGDTETPPPPPPEVFNGTSPNQLNALLAQGDVRLTTPGSGGYGIAGNTTLVIPEGRTLYVETILNVRRGGTLRIEGSVVVLEGGRINNDGSSNGGGTIEIANGGRFINYGYVENVSGSSIFNHGTITNNGTTGNLGRFEVRGNTRFTGTGTVDGSRQLNIHRDAIRN
ncbi:MAG: discoidin domain-containing protein [Oscillospiraceae bacterium]|nr:discoidin domain-containing protein [Oscillospiraceae bacterium]